MKVRCLKGCAGVYDGKGFKLAKGEVYENLPKGLVEDLLKAGHVEPVKGASERRKATVKSYQKRG